MPSFEYKAVPAPNRPKRVKGLKGTAARFAALLTDTMNEQARDGWEYLRSDSLPVEEKPGLLKSRVETYQTMLIFRRATTPAEEVPMAGYIEDQSHELAAEAQEPAPPPAAEPAPAEDPAPPRREEPQVTAGWAGSEDMPQDPPLHAPQDDSPFAEPEDTPNQILRS